MKYYDQDNRVFEILEEIQRIQSTPYISWFKALGNQIKVDKLHTELDQMGYAGDRPPRVWRHNRLKPN